MHVLSSILYEIPLKYGIHIIPIFGQEQPLPDPIHQFCEKHLPTIKSYIDKLSTILPLPVKCTVEGKCVTCHHKSTHDVYNNCKTHYVVYYNDHKTTQCVFIHHKTQDRPCCIYVAYIEYIPFIKTIKTTYAVSIWDSARSHSNSLNSVSLKLLS